eukprot:scaffold112345_cov60-Phaeocystis_antarctica.AAC.2
MRLAARAVPAVCASLGGRPLTAKRACGGGQARPGVRWLVGCGGGRACSWAAGTSQGWGSAARWLGWLDAGVVRMRRRRCGVGWRRCWLGARGEAGTGSETAIVCLKHIECHFAFRICQRGHTRVELLSKDDAAVQAAQYSVIVTHLDRHVLLPDDFSPVQHLRLPFSLLAALLGHPDLGGWPRCLATAASGSGFRLKRFSDGLEG